MLGDTVRLLSESYNPADILITSFSRAAAAEIAERGIGDGDIRVGTLHSLGYNAIGQMPILERHKDLKLEWNKTYPDMQFNTTASKWDPADPYEGDISSNTGDELMRDYSIARSRLETKRMEPSLRRFADRYEDFKTETGCIDYADMIELPYKDCDICPGDPDVMLVDEAQDLTPLELALVRKWGQHMDKYYLVGDDDQSIYGFRGADPQVFLNPPTDRKTVLDQSYRVPIKVHALSQMWIKQIRKREPKEYKPTTETGAVRTISATWKDPSVLVSDALKQAKLGKTCMILGYCGYLLEPIIAELKEQGVPFHNPYRKSAYHWNPLAQNRDDVVSAADRLKAYKIPTNTDRMWTGRELARWLETVKAAGIIKRGVKKQIVTLYYNDTVLQLAEIAKYLDIDFLARLEKADYPYHEYTDRLLAGYGNIKYAARVAEHHGIEMLDTEPSIIVGTIHSVKGGEADVVYVLPDVTAQILRNAEMSTDEFDSLVRLYYVAVTRAREQLVICEPARWGQCVDLEDYIR